ATPKRWRSYLKRHERPLLVAVGALFVIALVIGHAALMPSPRELTQQDIDSAVLHTLENTPPASHASKAYEAVRRSVVRVRGIGPSVSAGVVSGLRREYDAKDRPALTNLIQFDAAVNPGNSGGPLVTVDGEVVGIVTAILNPTDQHVFIGIGFAVPIENAAGAFGMAPF